MAVVAVVAVVVVVAVRGGNLVFGCFGAHTFSTYGKGKRFGQRACIGRVA